MKIKAAFFMGLAVSILLLGRGFAAEGDEQAIVVIVHTGNPISKMSSKEIKAHYLKKARRKWDNDEKIRPIDRIGNPRSRKLFLSKVLD